MYIIYLWVSMSCIFDYALWLDHTYFQPMGNFMDNPTRTIDSS